MLTVEQVQTLGSASEGTLRSRDLLPSLAGYYQVILTTPQFADAIASDISVPMALQFVAEAFGAYQMAEEANADHQLDYDGDVLDVAMDWVFDLETRLNEIAPEGWYFGCHPHNGSDYGYWRCDTE